VARVIDDKEKIEKRREYQKKWYLANKERIKEYKQKHYAENKEKYAKSGKKYLEENPDAPQKVRDYQKNIQTRTQRKDGGISEEI